MGINRTTSIKQTTTREESNVGNKVSDLYTLNNKNSISCSNSNSTIKKVRTEDNMKISVTRTIFRINYNNRYC